MVSLGLHGLAMLMPLPDKEKIVENPEEVTLPEPITVTTLPKPGEADLPSVIDPALPDAPLPDSLIPAPAMAKPSTGIAPPPLPEPIPDPSPTNPNPPASSPNPTPPPATPSPTNPPITLPSYSSRGATNSDQLQEVVLFAAEYGRPKDISVVLDLTYPAPVSCFDRDTNLEASVGIVVNDQGELVYSKLFKLTGYPAIDDWLTDYISLAEQLPDYVFTQLRQTIPDAVASGDLIEWLYAARNSDDLFVAADRDQAAYAFKIAVKAPCG